MLKNHSFFSKSIVHYFLSILLLVLCFTVIRLFLPNCTNKRNNELNIDKSSISSHNLVEYTYVDDYDPKSLSGLTSSTLIYEYMDYNFNHIYKSLVETPMNKESSYNDSMKFDNTFNLPRFKILELNDLEKASPNKANSIFVSFNGNISTNFIYKNGEYFYYKNKEPFVDLSNNSYLKVSNIIIQMCDTEFPNDHTIGKGNALLFQGGKFIKIKWDNEASPIRFYDENGNDISLLNGKTWWLITNKNTSIIYN